MLGLTMVPPWREGRGEERRRKEEETDSAKIPRFLFDSLVLA
jgi:hypothetical protein